MTGIALHKHGSGLEYRHCDFSHRELLVVGLLGRDNGCIRAEHEMNARVGHQVGLKLGNVDIQGTVESKRSCQGRDDLGQQEVQVCVCRALNVQVPAADVIQSLVVIHDGHISVLEEGVDAKHRIVGLYDGSCNLGASPDCEAPC